MDYDNIKGATPPKDTKPTSNSDITTVAPPCEVDKVVSTNGEGEVLDTSFSTLGVPEELCNRLSEHGINTPTKIQTLVIPSIEENQHTVFQSDTGSGKTLAYLLPLAKSIMTHKTSKTNKSNKDDTASKDPAIVIIAPNYELSSQIKEQVTLFTPLKSVLIIKGASMDRQIQALKSHPDIIVGTCNRILELHSLKKLRLKGCKALVLDEADRLLDRNDREETATVYSLTSPKTQLIACSATISPNIQSILNDYTMECSGVATTNIILKDNDVLKHNIEHWAFYSEDRDKIDTLRGIIRALDKAKILVFTPFHDQIANIVSKLQYHHIDCVGLHARMDKVERKSAIARFRREPSGILVTTDLCSRGIDIPNITHIIQMGLIDRERVSVKAYTHRVGRTARIGAKGVSIVIGNEGELRLLRYIEVKAGLIVHPKCLYGGKIIDPPPVNNGDKEYSED